MFMDTQILLSLFIALVPVIIIVLFSNLGFRTKIAVFKIVTVAVLFTFYLVQSR